MPFSYRSQCLIVVCVFFQTSVLANDLATVYDEKGRYNKAIRLAEKAIKIAGETAPENLATYKYNLGHILMHAGLLQNKFFSTEKTCELLKANTTIVFKPHYTVF